MRAKDVVLKFLLNVVKLRWLVAFCLFIIMVCFKIHFSSIGTYYEFLPTVNSETEKNEHTLIGKQRSIRSDEWAVHTPKCMAQTYNNFSKYSTQGSLSPTNEIVDYYVPVKDITLIGKPFNWGYVLFGREYGLSFYSCMIQILLFMTSFEMFFIITNRRILISLIGMFFVALAPVIQWWLIPHMPIVFVYGMGVFSLLYYMFTFRRFWQKVCCGVFLVIAMVGFCLSIFPSVQVPLVMLFIALLVVLLARNREEIVFNGKSMVLLFLVFAVVFAIIAQFTITSIDDLSLIINTEYPGKRLDVGGERKMEDLFINLTNLFLPGKDVKFSNNCELATFIHFSPILILVYLKIRQKVKENMKREFYVGEVLFYSLLIEIIFMCVGFTETLSKLTLFKYINRMVVIYGFTSVVFGVWIFNILWRNKNMLTKRSIIVYSAIYCFLFLTIINLQLRQYKGLRWLFLEIMIFVMILAFALLGYRKTVSLLVFGVMMFCGGRVNPVCVGISPITNHPISSFVENKIKTQPDCLWLVIGNFTFFHSNFLLANGARVINATHFYPDLELWRNLDLDESGYKIYNRYAHFDFLLTKGKEKIRLKTADSVEVSIKPETLKKLNIKYIFIREELLKDVEWPENFSVCKELKQDGFFVCSLKY